jgi:4-hydroxy-3-methylbut-2-enyl diphosphate reductase
MRVYTVPSAGFCWGVAEAIDKALEIAKRDGGPVFSYGPLVHNHQVMEQLEAQHVHGIEASHAGIAQAAAGTIVVRAHGVRPDVLDSLEKRAQETGAKFYDLTCPLVRMVHNVISGNVKRGFETVIVGDADHAEVIGLVGYGAPGKTHVVANAAEAEKLPAFDRVCVVSQTTQDCRTFMDAVEVVRRKSRTCRPINTICRPTQERQDETEEFARRLKTMVVVGGRHSANTVRLVELLKSWGCTPIHVETESELRKADFEGLTEVGLTAGASTPTWLIDRVEEKLESFGAPERTTLADIVRFCGSLLVQTNLYVAAGAAALTAAACRFQDIPLDPRLLAIPALFVMSMHTLNRFVDRTRLDFTDHVATWLYKKHWVPLLTAGALAGIASAVLAAFAGPLPFGLALLGLACGAVYGFRVLPEALTWRLGIRRLKDIPASRDLSTAVGWTMMTAVLPFLTLGRAPGAVNLLTFACVLLLVFLRTAALGVRDVSGDRIVGRETIVKALGAGATRNLALAMLAALAGCLAALAFGFGVKGALWACAVVPYVGAYLVAFFRRGAKKGLRGDLVTDGQNLVFGALAFANAVAA